MDISIVTDSTSDIPPELAAQLGIHQIPAIVIIDGKDFEDGEGISREEFYARLPEMETPPSTAAPSTGSFERVYERVLGKGFKQVVSIHVSAGLSGLYNAARLGAQPFGDRVRVIDSGQVTMGLGFQVLAAAEAVREGASLDDVMAVIQDTRMRIRVMAMLDTLEYLRRSGRISWTRARLGSVLKIKPFVEVRDGLVHSLGEVRTRRKGIDRLIETISELGGLERLALLHTNAEGDARRIVSALNLDLKYPALFINVTTAIGSHVGPNGLGFAAVLER